MDNIEIEIKAQVEQSKPLRTFLKESAKFTGTKNQIDSYFSPPHRNFMDVRPVKEWLRIRETDKGNSVNYKNWHYNDEGKASHCDEYETIIDNPNNIREVFTRLNYQPLVVVNKKRQTWRYKNYEIALDDVKDLGKFVEIEYKAGTDQNPEDITREMINFLKEKNCGTITRVWRGYPFMLMFPDEHHKEEA
jgi:adenylate cyclase, class 2